MTRPVIMLFHERGDDIATHFDGNWNIDVFTKDFPAYVRDVPCVYEVEHGRVHVGRADVLKFVERHTPRPKARERATTPSSTKTRTIVIDEATVTDKATTTKKTVTSDSDANVQSTTNSTTSTKTAKKATNATRVARSVKKTSVPAVTSDKVPLKQTDVGEESVKKGPVRTGGV